MTKRSDNPPTIRVKPHSYQPSKAEREATIRFNATPDQIIRAAVTPVRIVEDPDAWTRISAARSEGTDRIDFIAAVKRSDAI